MNYRLVAVTKKNIQMRVSVDGRFSQQIRILAASSLFPMKNLERLGSFFLPFSLDLNVFLSPRALMQPLDASPEEKFFSATAHVLGSECAKKSLKTVASLGTGHNAISSDLYRRFLEEMSNLLCSELFQELSSQKKVLGVLLSNFTEILRDKELPVFIRETAVKRIPHMAVLIDQMLNVSRQDVFMADGETWFENYSTASGALKKALISARLSSGITFSGRSLNLFKWCRIELPATAHPLVGYLLEKAPLDIRENIAQSFSHLSGIMNQMILQITCGDDIADNIQDQQLTAVFANIPFLDRVTRAKDLKMVSSYRKGMFEPYYKVTLEIWDDILSRLENLFGKSEWEMLSPTFLDLYKRVMNSLVFSEFMNRSPHDDRITLDSISENLAPNMMVQCFRFLEEALVRKLSEGILLLPEEDIACFNRIIPKSQKSASGSNAAATASRELRENDISNPVPFVLNTVFTAFLQEQGISFLDRFNTFLLEQKYENHFFQSYSDHMPQDADCLYLLLLRRHVFRQIAVDLGNLEAEGVVEVPDTDYSLATLAQDTIRIIQNSDNESLQISMKLLTRYTGHVRLIDTFFDQILSEMQAQNILFESWEHNIRTMHTDLTDIEDTVFSKYAKQYVDSWQDFLCMYLLFKRTNNGTV